MEIAHETFLYPCPNCRHSLQVAQLPEIGATLVCESCQVHFEIVWLYPLTLEPLVSVPLFAPSPLPAS